MVEHYLVALGCFIALMTLMLDVFVHPRRHQDKAWAYAAFCVYAGVGLLFHNHNGNPWVVTLLMFTAAAHPLQFLIPMPVEDGE